MPHYNLIPSPSSVHWGYLDASLRPVLEIEPGDTVHFRTVSGTADDLPEEDRFHVRPELRAIHAELRQGPGPHILNGPVYVRGALPGDALRVTIEEIALADDWGFNLTKPGCGLLPDDFSEDAVMHLEIDVAMSRIKFPWGQTIPARPFFGIIATAPAPELGRLTSVEPGSFGGNMDNKELTSGSVLFLPVAAPGGLLSVGDGHASQGDGEVCLTAVETGLMGALRVDLVKSAFLSAPHAETPTHLISMAFHEDLEQAARIGVHRMIGLIAHAGGLSREQAYRLCSIAADVRITQVVNGRRGVHVMLPLEIARGGTRT